MYTNGYKLTIFFKIPGKVMENAISDSCGQKSIERQML